MTGNRFAGRVVLVTGASSGIGKAAAERLASEGAAVVLAARRKERLDAVAASISAAGGKAVVVTGDACDSATGPAWTAASVDAFGRLDGLVNAAGVIFTKGLLDTEPDEWDHMLNSNLKSIQMMVRAAAPELVKHRGAIVNISSVAATRPYAAVGAYCVSKAGVDMLTQCLAMELADKGVRVNAVNPGVVRTELHTVTNAVPDYDAFLERSKSTHPLGRWAEPGEIAALVAYLMSEEASWITGACYAIDGGRALASAR
jgi:NAD(P)-dependent dehydrogenase (short-subunit alcohol dehydrogenase family)